MCSSAALSPLTPLELDEQSQGSLSVPQILLQNPDWALQPDFHYVLGHYLLHRTHASPFFFIQIGAFDGVSGDAIYPYVRRLGWDGVLVEPQEHYFSRLKQNYEGCAGLKLLKAAIADQRGSQTLYTLSNPEDPDLPSWAPQIASFSLETFLKHKIYIPDLESRIQSETVECITFNDILNETGTATIDLLQIDVEGYDYQILKMIDFTRIKPSIIRFEHKHLSPDDYGAALSLLGQEGYGLLPETYDTVAYLRSQPS